MIFAKVNVDLVHHHRLLRIAAKDRAEAMGIWLAALCYSRGNELDGFCPLEAIDQIARAKVVDELVRVGLFTRDEQDGVHGVRVLRYAEHNETKSDIESRRAYDRKRKTNGFRPEVPPEPPRTPTGFRSESERTPEKFPDSDSGSVSEIGERDSEGSTGIRPTADGAFGMVVSNWCDGIRQITGVPMLQPRGAPLRTLLESVRAHCPQGTDPVNWVREQAMAYAKAQAGVPLSPFKFGDWLSSGRPDRNAPRVFPKPDVALTAEGLDPSSYEASVARKKRRKAEEEQERAELRARLEAQKASAQ